MSGYFYNEPNNSCSNFSIERMRDRKTKTSESKKRPIPLKITRGWRNHNVFFGIKANENTLSNTTQSSFVKFKPTVIKKNLMSLECIKETLQKFKNTKKRKSKLKISQRLRMTETQGFQKSTISDQKNTSFYSSTAAGRKINQKFRPISAKVEWMESKNLHYFKSRQMIAQAQTNSIEEI